MKDAGKEWSRIAADRDLHFSALLNNAFSNAPAAASVSVAAKQDGCGKCWWCEARYPRYCEEEKN